MRREYKAGMEFNNTSMVHGSAVNIFKTFFSLLASFSQLILSETVIFKKTYTHRHKHPHTVFLPKVLFSCIPRRMNRPHPLSR